MKKITLAFAALIVLAACEKKEEAFKGYFSVDTPGSANLVAVNGVDYPSQVYYDLSTAENKKQNIRDVWDLALGCDASKPNLFTNPSMLASVAPTGSFDFDATFNPDDFDFSHERAGTFFHKGKMMKNWQGTTPDSEVFIIDLGKTLKNKNRGYKLFQVLSFDGVSYTIKFSDLDHSNLQEVTVNVDDTYTHVYILFENPEEVLTLEPPKEEWDILFTKYMERLYDGAADTLDYSVTGALINPYKTVAYFHEESYADSTWNYTDLTRDDIEPNRYTSYSAVIGHDWKYYDLDVGAYSVMRDKCFFIKDGQEIEYRFHFTGFYDGEGRKGLISFEHLQL